MNSVESTQFLSTDGKTCIPIFFQAWWLDAVAPGSWGEVVIEKGGKIHARLPYVLQRKHGLTLLTMPPLTQTFDPWLSWPQTRGGIQKEAYCHGKRCVILRNKTEWVELVEAGWNVVVGVDPDRIAAALAERRVARDDRALYCKGNAAKIVVRKLVKEGWHKAPR